MVLASPLVKLHSKLTPHVKQPRIVISRLTNPDSTGMILVRDLVALISIEAVGFTMSSRHELSVLNHHFGAMGVGVVLSTQLGVGRQKKDVHIFLGFKTIYSITHLKGIIND